MKIEKCPRKKGVGYRARFSVNYTSFISPWLSSTQEARDWAAQKRTDVIHGHANTGSEITFENFSKLWLEKHAFVNKVYSAAIRDQHALKLLMPILRTKKLRALTSANVEFAFSDFKRAGNHAPKTLNNYLGTVKKMLNDAVRWGYILHNPAARVPLLKLTRQEVTVFYHEEIAKLLAFTADRYPDESDLIMFAINTGCRLGECLALDWNKVDFTTRFALIDSTYEGKLKQVVPRTKGKRFRRIPLNDDSVAMLRERILKGKRQQNRYVFGELNYEYITHEKFRMNLEGAGLEDAIARRATFHCLRHTFASEFMRTGGNLYDLQHLLGHSTITQTEKYAHFAPDYLRGATQRICFSRPPVPRQHFSAPDAQK